ncbi:MAG TPA: ABC transporter permease [Hanamia sp.]|jgi:predicted permease|nr:ABC transporter permease [Hanamia sp.]
MFKNYLKTTFRNLWKNKGYTFLNIFGLAIGIACAALIFLWVEDELNYNDYFSNKENLYKIKDSQTYDGTTFTFDATPGPLAPGIKSEIPGIKNTARTTWGNQSLFSLDDKNIYEQGMYVDSSFLSMFGLKFIQGKAATAFQQLYSVVISKKMAEKFFGSTNVVGKSLRVDNKQNYVVSGVIEDLPENVSFKFDWVAPFKIYLDQNDWLQQWGNNGIVTYVETASNANIASINKKLYNYLDTKGQGFNAKFSIYPMSRWRMYDSWKNGKEVPGRIKFVNLFSLIAWIILIIACINFMNLSTARSEQRAREVGVRKVLGAGKGKLIVQFIGESLIMALISALVAIGIVYLALPAFNSLVEKQLFVGISNPVHIVALLAIALICGLIAGSYPAFYLSSFNPVTVLKGLKIKSSGSAGFIRKGLVIVQFSISIVLIISTIIVYQQIHHVKNRDLGYNKQNLIYLQLQGNMKQHFNAIKNDLLQTGVVQNAALSRSIVLQLGSNTGNFQWQGKDPNKQVLITVEGVSPEYTSTMGMHIKEGRDFYADIKSDSNNVIINETLAKIMGGKNILGSVLSQGDSKYTVVGVMKDFIYNNMYSPSSPLILFPDTSSVNYLTIRLNAKHNLPESIAKVEKVIKTDNPGFPFEAKFVDEQFDQFFKAETLIGKLASVFSVLAIFISCLGLFGLAAYTAERRTKEIGIRKVLGASAKGLAGLLSKDFLYLVAFSCILAFPIAWWMMHNWLEKYEYRINISWTIFLIAGLLALLIALITVSFQAIKVALSNPVKSLRSE